MRDVKFVKAVDVLGVIYRSKSGNTDLKWRQTKGSLGRLTGEASPNPLVNLIESGIIRRDFIKKKLEELSQKEGEEAEQDYA